MPDHSRQQALFSVKVGPFIASSIRLNCKALFRHCQTATPASSDSTCENGASMPYLPLAAALLIPIACLGTSIVRVSFEQTVGPGRMDRRERQCRSQLVCGMSGHRFIWTHTEVAVRGGWKGCSRERQVVVPNPAVLVGE